jgi:hypothetical protein
MHAAREALVATAARGSGRTNTHGMAIAELSKRFTPRSVADDAVADSAF